MGPLLLCVFPIKGVPLGDGKNILISLIKRASAKHRIARYRVSQQVSSSGEGSSHFETCEL